MIKVKFKRIAENTVIIFITYKCNNQYTISNACTLSSCFVLWYDLLMQ